MSNPRFPHTCTISKSVGDVQLGTATETLVYRGSCRKELNNFNDQNPANAANTAQWLLSMPVVLRLEYGIKVVVDDGVADGVLRADHIVVEAAHQLADLGVGEEAQTHSLQAAK